MKENDSMYRYTYSAKEQAELKRIRDKYLTEAVTEQADKMERLRRLDAGVTNRATTVALCVGIVSLLVMGFGMSLLMSELGDTMDAVVRWAVGLSTGLVGMLGVIVAYPLYHHVLDKGRKKIAPEILRLTDELMKE